jgi:DNA-binding CsgD family transcriptional regulator
MTLTVTKRASTPTKPAPLTRSVPLSAAERVFGVTGPTALARHVRLTPREVQVAGLMADAKRNRQIAEELGISVKTLDIHRANLMRKLEVRTTAGVANLVNLVRLVELVGA